jgi:hypothetical protein
VADKGGGSGVGSLLTGLGDLLIPQTMGAFNDAAGPARPEERHAAGARCPNCLGGGYEDPNTQVTYGHRPPSHYLGAGGQRRRPHEPDQSAVDLEHASTRSGAEGGPKFAAKLLSAGSYRLRCFPAPLTKEDVIDTKGGALNLRTNQIIPGTAPPAAGANEFVNLKGPDGKVHAYSKASAAPLLAKGDYQVAGDVSMQPREEKETWAPMTEAQLAQWRLPPGTVAKISSTGNIDIVNKAAPGSFLTDQGIAPDATPDEVRSKLSSTTQGANIVRQADAVLRGDEELQKVTSRAGETLGNQVRAAVYALEPGFNPMKGKQRVQVNQELNNLSDKAFGGKLASADKIVNHASDLLASAVDMKNNSMFGNVGNKVENAVVGAAPGSTMKTNIREFTDIRTKLATESAKFMGGGAASDAARDEINHSYNPNDDLTGTIGAVSGTLQTMVGQIQPMVDRYNQAYGTNLPITDPKFMSPETAKKLTAMQSIVDAAKSGQKLNPQTLKAQLKNLGVGRISPDKAPAAGAATPPAGVVIQNGWKYDAVTHKPIGPANGGR